MNSRELYYQVAHTHLADQDDRNRQLETKATAILGLSATMLGFGVFTVEHWLWWSYIPGIITFAAFVYTAFSSLKAVWVRKWDRRPQLNELATHIHSGEYKDEGLIEWVADQYSTSIDLNEPIIVDKAGWIRTASVGLALEAAALGFLILGLGIRLAAQQLFALPP
jgi:hypothetical protein